MRCSQAQRATIDSLPVVKVGIVQMGAAEQDRGEKPAKVTKAWADIFNYRFLWFCVEVGQRLNESWLANQVIIVWGVEEKRKDKESNKSDDFYEIAI